MALQVKQDSCLGLGANSQTFSIVFLRKFFKQVVTNFVRTFRRILPGGLVPLDEGLECGGSSVEELTWFF